MLPPFGQDVASVAPFYGRLVSLPLRQAVTTNRKDLKLSFTEGRNPFRFRGKGTASWLSPAAMYSVVPVGTKVSELHWSGRKVATSCMAFVCHALACQHLHATRL